MPTDSSAPGKIGVRGVDACASSEEPRGGEGEGGAVDGFGTIIPGLEDRNLTWKKPAGAAALQRPEKDSIVQHRGKQYAPWRTPPRVNGSTLGISPRETSTRARVRPLPRRPGSSEAPEPSRRPDHQGCHGDLRGGVGGKPVLSSREAAAGRPCETGTSRNEFQQERDEGARQGRGAAVRRCCHSGGVIATRILTSYSVIDNPDCHC